MHVFLTQLGCRLNEAEVEDWARRFRGAGHQVVATPERAQVMVVNTCAVTAEAARKSRKYVGGLHRQNPAAPLVITGCWSELEPARAAELAGVDLVVGNRDKDRLVELVADKIDPAAMPQVAADADDGSHVYAYRGRTRAFVKVQDGCRNKCAFCIVTVARGDERSRTIDHVVAEVAALHEAGYQEAVLTGVHLGGYGADLGTDLRALVQALLDRTTIPRLRLSSLEPWDLPAGFFELWRDRRLQPHLHLPLQSGCDATLRRMARRCFTADYAALVAEARAAIPDLTVTTDLIVGFPGESDDEHQATLAFAGAIGFGHVHTFSFSARQGTRAARMPGAVTDEVKRARSRQVHELAARMKAAHLAGFVGATRRVLWEGAGEPQPDGSLCWSGYTDNYLRVQTRVPAGSDLDNRIVPARLTGIDGDGLIGELSA
ncbi:MAG TPA: tRNA (N(6)-L-threonylcarbamoyladenosine(37)-C(2))-methylthiotransferase MtaB [Kofleriaceae bacterium]|nr:tRNA (N(6)-L-threonylcarbamoyladenosine(37)-C(2))-methylthiotransferase MtaB [Kofleriaceae bacterium]